MLITKIKQMVFSNFMLELCGVDESLSLPSLVLTALLCALIILVIARQFNHHRRYRGKKFPPGYTGLPVVGWTPFILLSKDKDRLGGHLAKMASKYGEIYYTSVPPFSKDCIVVNSHEAIQFILSRENRGVVQLWPSSTRQLLGSASLAALTGVAHKQLRSKLLPIFQPKYLEEYTLAINSIVVKHLENNWHEGKQLVAAVEMRSIIFSIGINLVLGLDGTCSTEDQETIEKLKYLIQVWFGGLFMPALHFPGSPFTKAMNARQELVSILSDLVLRRKKQVLETEKESNTLSIKNGDMLSVLIQPRVIKPGDKPTYLTDEEIIDTLITFIFAATDTSSCALTWIIKRLSESPDLFEKLKIEHSEIVERRKETEQKQQHRSSGSSNGHSKNRYGHLTSEEIESASFTKQIIQESLRKDTVISALNRVAEKDLYYKDFVIPKGSNLLIDLKTLMQNPKDFLSPQDFCTDRTFKTGFLPFGSGVKMCIGKPLAMAEMTVIIHHLVLDYAWAVPPGARTDDVTYFPMPIFNNGFPINITKSKSTTL